jgi:hypothetical protein
MSSLRLHNSFLNTSILSRGMYDSRGGLEWRMDLLTTYTHNSELQAITAPPLISTIYKGFSSLLCVHQPFPGNGF